MNENMPWYIWLFLALCALYLWMIAPRRRPKAAGLIGRLYAHRGLHDGNHTVPENSPAAFRLAVESGYGIELDVQPTADGKQIVHHDDNTLRVCGQEAVIRQTAYGDLPPLPDGSPIPLFSDVLALVNGRAPLIVEIKPYGSPVGNAAATLEALRPYQGDYCIESFHPSVVRYFRKRAPGVVRGQLAMGGPFNRSETSLLEHFALKYLLINCLGRPHFIAYSCAADRNLSMGLMKRLFKPMLAAWTLRDQALLDYARKDYDMLLFERFIPDEKKC